MNDFGMRALIAALLIVLPFTPAMAREKLDVVYMHNGDRLTGQILVMQYGQLKLKTDYLGTATIEWIDVERIESPQHFVVEDLDGSYFSGVLDHSNITRQLTVIAESGRARTLRLDGIERIYAGERRALDRMEGSFSIGVDYAKAADIGTLAGSFDTAYRAPDFRWHVTADVNSTDDPEQGTLDRHSLGFDYQWLWSQQRFITGLGLLERNEATGVEARLQLGAGIGKYLLQTSSTEVSGMVGVAFGREWATGAEGAQDSIEAILGGSWRIYKFNTPSSSLHASALLFPNLTDTGRFRSSLNVSLRRELISNIYLDLSAYHSYDTEPPDEAAEKSDYGLTSSVGYSFY